VAVARGKVDVFISVDASAGDKGSKVTVNEALCDQYYMALTALRDRYQLLDDITVSLLSRMPDVMTVEKAEEAREEWLSLAGEQYQIDSEETVSYNGQEFTVITYRLTSGPYASGASAFGIYGNYAIGAEFSCQDGFEGEPLDYLSDFL